MNEGAKVDVSYKTVGKPVTVELHSKGFHGTGLIFSIDQNSFIANIEINRKIINRT